MWFPFSEIWLMSEKYCFHITAHIIWTTKILKYCWPRSQTDSTANQILPALEVSLNQNLGFRQYETFGNLQCRVKHQHLNSFLIITAWIYNANVLYILNLHCTESMAKVPLTPTRSGIIFTMKSTEIVAHLCLFSFQWKPALLANPF